MENDVIIVGAGPAGSTAAIVLARAGRRVLMLDRAAFPRDKPCGDGIPPGTVGILHDLGLKDALRAADFQPIDTLRLVSARGRDWRLRFTPRREGAGFFIARRVQFDDLLFRHALACGTSFQQANVRAPLFDNGHVVGVRADVDGVERELRARVVVGADGATSAMARALLPAKPPERHRAVAIRAYLERFDALPHTVEFHFGARFAPGYAWVFPLGDDSANVGVVVRTDRFKRRGASIEQLLREFIESKEMRARRSSWSNLGGIATWQLPLAVPHSTPRAFDGAVLVGDAARLVDALTGEGIHNAVMSGKLAADAVAQALDAGDVSRVWLSAYERRLEDELGALTKRSYRCQKYVTAFPLALESLFVLAGTFRESVMRWLDRASTDFRVAE
ncbi:MAG TPA: geranylgeranyl reductase family protein [Candidatus Krumholzibacteria bacterium]|nr:geranylgeranyl reductase family protein [Candidatus Krumholzibacteria bacterium]